MDPREQQREILKLAAEGMTRRQIARKLQIPESRVAEILAKRGPPMDLTDQEREILKLAADGATTREIARELQLPDREASAILHVVFRKLRGEE